MKTIIILLAVIVLFSCNSSEEQKNSASSVASFWGAKNFNVEEVELKDKNESDVKTMVLTLEDLQKVSETYPDVNITSLSALKLIANIPEYEYANYDGVKIIVNNKSKRFEKEYKIAEIITARKLLNVIDAFFKKIDKSDYKDFSLFFDTTSVSNSVIQQIEQLNKRIDSTLGKPMNSAVVSFDFKTFSAANVPVFITHIEKSYKNEFSDYIVVLRVSDKKVIHFGLNEKK